MEASTIIKNSGLRLTSSRKKIISILIKSQTALSEVDLEKRLASVCDRTTIYRTLHTLLENGIVHKLIDTDGSGKYVLNRGDATSAEHIHFKCNECGAVKCLEDSLDQYLNLPQGYQKLYTNFVVVGVCAPCHAYKKE